MAPTGYAWWYIDAESDDGRYALSTIAFVGSVFSPNYARAHARTGQCDPRHFAAFNLALYGPTRAWAFSEMPLGRASDATTLQLGASAWRRVEGGIDIDVAEIALPLRRAVRGTIRLRGRELEGRQATPIVLRERGQHLWLPVMPNARIEVELDRPRVRWQGRAYHDANRGDEPLARGFARWDWMREMSGDKSAVYFRLVDAADEGTPSARGVSGVPRTLALEVDAEQQIKQIAAPRWVALQKSRWGVERFATDEVARTETVEDTPFYARARLATQRTGVSIMHESIDLRRWQRRWVQFLLGFRLRKVSSSR